MMVAKSKYKMTELGEVPNDWNIASIEDVGSTMSGGTPNRANKSYYVDGNIPWVKTGELKNKYIEFPKEFITETAIKNSSAKIIGKNSVILAMYGATIGQVSILPFPATTNQACCAIISDKQVYFEFLYYYLKSKKSYLISLGAGGAQPNISQQIIRKIKIVLPPLKEQKKIAEILSTVDEQIEQTDQLIEKTKELKKGLMQQLLTKGVGHTVFKQTELGEIPVEWTVSNINDVAEVQTGGTPLRSNSNFWKNGSIPWMSSGEVNKKIIDGVAEKITEEGFNNSNTTMLPKGTVMLAMNGQGKTRGTVAYLKIETTCNQSLAGIITNENYNSLFLYYFLEYSYDNLRNINGEGRSGLNLKLIRDFKVIVPSLNEQQKTAEILTSVDKNIEGYEEEKDKYEELKKGLMQQLLTGKTRVKVD